MCQIVLNNNFYGLMAFIAQNNLAKIYMKAFWYVLHTAGCHNKMGHFKPLQFNETFDTFFVSLERLKIKIKFHMKGLAPLCLR